MKRFGLLAAAGAIVGSLLRYAVTLAIPHSDPMTWPWATFAVNVIGALAIGIIANLPAVMNEEARRYFVVTGVLGGFTTFSALAVEVIQLSGFHAWLYVVLTFVVGISATHMGSKLLKS
jgi:CrcB protein